MTSHAQVVTRIDSLAEHTRDRLAADVIAWLRRHELIAASPRSTAEREQYGLAPWVPGSAWRTIVEEPEFDLEQLLHNGVSVTAEPEIQSAHGNSEDPVCRRCSKPFPLYESFEVLDDWLAGGREPGLTCDSCGWTELVGNWESEFPLALLGAPTVTFNNWPALKAEFVDALIVRLGGGRCRYFHRSI